MKYVKKADREKAFVDYIKGIGIKWHCKALERGNWYYCLELNNGEIRYWTNFSEESLKELGIEYESND